MSFCTLPSEYFIPLSASDVMYATFCASRLSPAAMTLASSLMTPAAFSLSLPFKTSEPFRWTISTSIVSLRSLRFSSMFPNSSPASISSGRSTFMFSSKYEASVFTFSHQLQKWPDKISGHLDDLVSSGLFSSGLGLFLFPYTRFFVMFTLSQFAHNAITSTRTFESLQRTFQAFVFFYDYMCHSRLTS